MNLKRIGCTAVVLGALLGTASACSGPPQSASTVAASTGPASTGDPHLRCAAVIGANSHLVAQGKLPAEADLQGRGLVAAMTHMNAYAIPKQLPEKEGFALVNTERERLMRDVAPDAIAREAKACLQ